MATVPFYLLWHDVIRCRVWFGYNHSLLIALKLLNLKIFPEAGHGYFIWWYFHSIWGALFGGWFGLEWHPLWFVPFNEPLKMLILCYVLGALHILFRHAFQNLFVGQRWRLGRSCF